MGHEKKMGIAVDTCRSDLYDGDPSQIKSGKDLVCEKMIFDN